MGIYNSGFDNAVVVTPSDTTVLDPFQQLFVGGTGTVAVLTIGGQSVTFTGVLAGTILPIRGTKVLATGTSATNIVAMR